MTLEPAEDAVPAAWLPEEVRDFDHTVGSVVPAGFEAYARVFHPAWLRRETGAEHTPVRWSTIAAARGTTLHAVAEWGPLSGHWHSPGERGARLREDSEPGLWDSEPDHGSLDAASLAALAAVLAGYTATPESCWYGVWEGYGSGSAVILFPADTPPDVRDQITEDAKVRDMRAEMRRTAAAVFTLPDRPMSLLRGPLATMGEADPLAPFGLSGQSPNIWWPDDRAWCVGTEIDLMTTYVAGSAACVEAICAAPGLEALPASVDQGVAWDSDTINPLPGQPPSQ